MPDADSNAAASRRFDGMSVAVGLFSLVALGLVVGRAVGWIPISWLEIFAAIAGAACVLLVLARNIWNFPVGIASCAAYLVFFAEGRLYANAGLQVAFVALSLLGWWTWARRPGGIKPVGRVPLGEMTVLAVAFPAVWLGLTELLAAVGGESPQVEAFIATLSLVSQWLLNRRYIESWLGWIVVDQVAVLLFWSRGMYLTAGLYMVFIAMCVAGLIEWRRDLRASDREGGRP